VPLKLLVSAFPEGGTIPKLHTGEGADVSPALEWTGAPPETQSFALIVDDPDAPVGTWTHWLIWDLPPATRHVAQGHQPGPPEAEGMNDFGRRGYGGPMPPKGHGPHRYFFKLFALDVASLGLPADSRRAAADHALQGHVLAAAQYMGRFERR
jgi:Raf kinase inhibitor-like YbhB/YbcL family protein